MYAIIKSGGKQYRVSPGDEVILDKLPQAEGEKVVFEDLLLVNREGEVIVGKKLSEIKVRGTVLEQFKGEKIEVFKYRPKKRYRRKHGHRQLLTRVRIDEIEFPETKKEAKEAGKEKEKVKRVRKESVSKEKAEKRAEEEAKKRVSKKEEKAKTKEKKEVKEGQEKVSKAGAKKKEKKESEKKVEEKGKKE